MNVQAGENEVRYVFALSSSNSKHNSSKVSVENAHSSSTRHGTRHKKIESLPEIGEIKEETNSDDVELTVISENENGLVVGNAMDCHNTTDGSPVPKKRRSEGFGEQNSHKSKLILSHDHLLVRPSALGSCNRVLSTDDDDTEYVHLNHYHSKSASEETQERRPGKYKVFRDEWLDIDIFRDWLDRDPTNPRKARCVACNTTMNAGKSELEKHAAGARHERAVEVMHQAMLQQLAAAEAEEAEAEAEADVEQEVEGDEEADSSNETKHMHTFSLGNTEPVIMEQTLNPEETISIQEQQLDAINRVATAIETLSNNVSILVERMATQQGELIDVLRALQKRVCSEDTD